MEGRLRLAQCADALDSIRRILRIKVRMIQFKNKNLRGQREGTRSRAMIDRVHERARASAEKYRTARAAVLNLLGPGSWENRFRVLKGEDIRGFQDANKLRGKGTLEDDQLAEMDENVEEVEEGFELFEEERGRRDGTGETRRTLSWIWTTGAALSPLQNTDTSCSTIPKSTNAVPSPSTNSVQSFPNTRSTPASKSVGRSVSSVSSAALARDKLAAAKKDEEWKQRDRADDVLRGEWSKSRARAKRATEEVLLLKEEMSRVLKFLQWKARWWTSLGNGRREELAEMQEGVSAVALKNSALQSGLRDLFQLYWKAPLDDLSTAAPSTATPADDNGNDDDDDDNGDGDDDEDNEENEKVNHEDQGDMELEDEE